VITVHVYDSVLDRSGRRVVEVPGPSTAARVIAAARPSGLFDPPPWCLMVDGRPADADDPVPDGAVVHAGPRPTGIDPVTVGLFVAGLALSAISGFVLSTGLLPGADDSGTPAERRHNFGQVSSDAFAGDTIPVVLGRVDRYAGKIVSVIPGEGEDGSGDSSLRVLVCFGHGPIAAIGSLTEDADGLDGADITGIYLNRTEANQFPGTTVSVRMGSAAQRPIPGFDDAETLVALNGGSGFALVNTSGSPVSGADAGAESFTVTTASAVDAVVVRVRFPQGLYELGGGGQPSSITRSWRVRHRLHDAGGGTPGAWSAWRDVTVTKGTTEAFFSSPRLAFETAARRDIQAERVSVDSVGATIGDAMVWDSVVEIASGDIAYAGYAMLALTLTASEQLTSRPDVQADVRGLASVPSWDGLSDPHEPVLARGYSENPAWCVLAVIESRVWGMGGVERADLENLRDWAIVCDQAVASTAGGTRPRYRFGMAVDRAMGPRELLSIIAAAGRAVPVTASEVYRFVGFAPQPVPVEVFGDGDIAVDESGVPRIAARREASAGGVSRPNQVTAQYLNDRRDGESDTAAYPADGEEHLATEPARTSSIRLDGVTDPDQAQALVRHAHRKHRLLTREVTFTTTRPAVVVQPGDRFDLASSALGVALASGRLLGVDGGQSARLDRSVVLVSGAAYVLDVIHADGARTITPVSAGPGEYPAGTPVRLAAPIALAAGPGDSYALGEAGIVRKPYVCTSVALADADGLLWEISGVEYDAAVDDDDSTDPPGPAHYRAGPTLTAAVVTDPAATPGPLSALAVASVGDASVVLHATQLPVDRARTREIRVYRRRVGTTAWVRVPVVAASMGVHPIVLSMDLPADAACELVAVPVSAAGLGVSAWDAAHPRVTAAIGLGVGTPPVPASCTLARQADGSYTGSCAAVAGAVAYDWLSGGGATARPFVGAEACRVLARTASPTLAGLWPVPGVAFDLRARAVGVLPGAGAARADVASPLTPPGVSVLAADPAWDLAAVGTRVNLSWGTGGPLADWPAALRLVAPGLPGVYTTPAIDSGSVGSRTLHVWLETADGTPDVVLASSSILMPGERASHLGVVTVGASAAAGQVMPGLLAGQGWAVEARWSDDGSAWGAWAAVPATGRQTGTKRYAQVRVTMTASGDHRPGLRAVRAAVLG
jgi:hypothetical protein